jgi:isopenicillin-N epimerase
VAPVNDWALDPSIAFLNHGSYGATTRSVLDEQQRLRERMEANPVQFLFLDLPDLLAEARLRSAAFVGADAAGFGFVPNATTGTNALLRSWPLQPGDEVLLTNHGYEACNLAAEFIAARRGATVRFADIPVPVSTGEEIREVIAAAVTPRTRIAVIDHITSATGLVLPIASIVADLRERDVATIVDGAHAPGQVPLAVDELGAVGYTANWHKWTCAPKGAGFVWADRSWREDVRPVVISHGQGHRGVDGDRFRATFDWTGTADSTPYLCVPVAFESVETIGGGWPQIRDRNRSVALEMRDRIVAELGWQPASSDALTGSMVSFMVPQRWRSSSDTGVAGRELLRRLNDDHGVVIGVATRRETDDLFLRISAHLHTEVEAVERLIAALRTF